jgi:hypothetical protein
LHKNRESEGNTPTSDELARHLAADDPWSITITIQLGCLLLKLSELDPHFEAQQSPQTAKTSTWVMATPKKW